MNYQYAPIDRWPGKPTEDRSHSTFRADHRATVKLFDHELAAIEADGVIVKLAYTPRDFKKDGNLRQDAKPQHPGVIVSFHKPVVRPTGVVRLPFNFPCDRIVTGSVAQGRSIRRHDQR